MERFTLTTSSRNGVHLRRSWNPDRVAESTCFPSSKLVSVLDEGRDCVIVTTLRSDGTTLKSLYGSDGSVVHSAAGTLLPDSAEIVRSLNPRTAAHISNTGTGS